MHSESSRMTVLHFPAHSSRHCGVFHHSNAMGQRQELSNSFDFPNPHLFYWGPRLTPANYFVWYKVVVCVRGYLEASPPFHARKRSYRRHIHLGNYRLGFCTFCFQWEIGKRWDTFSNSPSQLLAWWYPSTHWGTSFLPLLCGAPRSPAPSRRSLATSPALQHQTLQMSALPQPKVPDVPELSSVPPQTSVPCRDPARSSGLCHHWWTKKQGEKQAGVNTGWGDIFKGPAGPDQRWSG